MDGQIKKGQQYQKALQLATSKEQKKKSNVTEFKLIVIANLLNASDLDN